MSHELSIHETVDRDELRALLGRDPVGSAYLLGDLSEPFFAYCQWLVGTYRSRAEGVVLVYRGLSRPVVLSFGAPDAVGAILAFHPEILASAYYAKIPLEHESAYGTRFETKERLWVMGLSQDEFCGAPTTSAVKRLGSDTPHRDLSNIFAEYPGNFFESSQLTSGIYYGMREEGVLVAVAGTHVLAPNEGVAVLGNIVTSQRVRGRGLGRACTSAVVSELFSMGCRRISLHVAAENACAIALYRGLGFRFHSIVLQASCMDHD